MKLYLEVTRDKYELPLKVETSPQLLAEKCEVSVSCVVSAISHYKHGRYKRSRFVSVEVDDETTM